MQTIDHVTVEVLSNNFLAIAEEMGVVLGRAAYSTSIKERFDHSVAIIAPNGEVMAQADHIPLHLASLLGLAHAIRERADMRDLRPGDVIITNDPYSGGGSHLPDITVAAPCFCDGQLVALVANTAHHDDIGGGTSQPRDIFGEGLRIPPLKIIEHGELREDVLSFILHNCRMPDQRRGDLQAQFAALRTGLGRLDALGSKYGADTLGFAISRQLDQAEVQARTAISQLPSGTFAFTDFMDNDGFGNESLPIQVEIRIDDDHITCDFTGTAPQVSGPINVIWSALAACVYYVIKAAVDPRLPSNGGYYRAITIEAPPGSLVNCSSPAAVGFRSDTAQRIVDALLGALAQAMPDRIPAASHSTVTGIYFQGPDELRGQYFHFSEGIAGGAGAGPRQDGADAVQVHMTNSANLPIESLEAEYPLLIERYGLADHTGGPGQYSGGRGIVREYRMLTDGIVFQAKGDRQVYPPWGLAGGQPGAPGRYTINPGTTGERTIPTKTFDVRLSKGDRVQIVTPGGGGYGPPSH